MPPEVLHRVLILLVHTQQAMQEYYICSKGEVDIFKKLTQADCRCLAQKADQHLQPLLQCSKAAESQTEIHSRSGTSFIHLMFRLIELFYFLLRYFGICHSLRSEWRPVAVFNPH